jgi:hypothetical protein
MARLILDNRNLVGPRMEIAFEVGDPVSSKACWVLEFTAKKRLPYLFPHLDYFTGHIGKVQLQSSVRPVAKICECLMLCFFSEQKNECQQELTNTHLQKIATASFDWLIGDHKVAVKAYSMTCLLLLGKEFDWIHAELKLVIEKNYAEGSAAHKARARHTLAKLKRLSR